MKERREETRNPTTFHFVTISDLTWVLDYHKLWFTTWWLSFLTLILHLVEATFCSVYCGSVSCSPVIWYFLRNVEYVHKQRKAGFRADYQDKSLSKPLKAPSFTKKSRIKSDHFLSKHNWVEQERSGCSVQSKWSLRYSLFLEKTKNCACSRCRLWSDDPPRSKAVGQLTTIVGVQVSNWSPRSNLLDPRSNRAPLEVRRTPSVRKFRRTEADLRSLFSWPCQDIVGKDDIITSNSYCIYNWQYIIEVRRTPFPEE